MIPLVDLKVQMVNIRREIHAVIASVCDSTTFVLGPDVTIFEQAFADFIGVKYCIGVSSGTAAIHLALCALGIGIGDEVITTPMTFIGTVEAISMTGATPVFVDVEDDTLNIDYRLVEQAITNRTRAIIPVHLYGQVADMDQLLVIAKRYNLAIVEDACQAHGATYKGRHAGSIGTFGCFSFYPGKNLGALGDAGAVTTNDFSLATRVRLLSNHGSLIKYEHSIVGFNCRMDSIQAAVLSFKLTLLKSWNVARTRLVMRYRKYLNGVVGLFTDRSYGISAHHLFVVQSPHRDEIFKRFDEHDIACAVHYPIPVHLQKAYANLGYNSGSFPVAEAMAKRILSLPLYPEMTDMQQDIVIDTLRSL